jgi:hypothetical protein
MPASSSSSSLLALESRNENLCATGLFEHFQEWRCTPIGNILDEGISKNLNDGELALTDSLLGKLQLVGEVEGGEGEKQQRQQQVSNNNNNKDKDGKKSSSAGSNRSRINNDDASN